MAIAPFATRGLTKMSGQLIRTAPGGEAAALDDLAEEALLNQPGAIILVGERLATSPGALSAASRLAAATGARLGWVPRRAGDRGALEAGALPNLLPGGRPVADASAREQTAPRGTSPSLPDAAGRDTAGILAAARGGELGALLIGGVELADLPDPDAALAAIDARTVRGQPGTAGKRGHRPRRRGVPGRAGGGEGRLIRQLGGPDSAVRAVAATNATPDLRVLHFLADEIGVDLGLPNAAAAGDELARLGWWGGARPAPHRSPPAAADPARARRCWPAGGCCWTRAGCRTANRTWREPHARRWRGCRRPPPPKSVQPKVIWSPSAPSGVDHIAAGDHRHGRPGGVAAAELAGLGGAPAARGDRGRGGLDRAG